jgi:hypothetical protein
LALLVQQHTHLHTALVGPHQSLRNGVMGNP